MPEETSKTRIFIGFSNFLDEEFGHVKPATFAQELNALFGLCKIRQKRRKKQWTKITFTLKCGVAYDRLIQWMRGRNVPEDGKVVDQMLRELYDNGYGVVTAEEMREWHRRLQVARVTENFKKRYIFLNPEHSVIEAEITENLYRFVLWFYSLFGPEVLKYEIMPAFSELLRLGRVEQLEARVIDFLSCILRVLQRTPHHFGRLDAVG